MEIGVDTAEKYGVTWETKNIRVKMHVKIGKIAIK